MRTLIIYDMPNDKARRKLIEMLKDYGLARVQFSAFIGELSNNRRQELMLRLSNFLDLKDGNIQMYVMCAKDEELMVEIDHSGYAARRYF